MAINTVTVIFKNSVIFVLRCFAYVRLSFGKGCTLF